MRAGSLRILFDRKMLICIFTGFSSGLPLFLLLNLLPAWLKTEGISLREIGLFALIQFPYTWKFLWAPLMDRYALPWLGRRRSWMAATHLALVGAICWLGTLSPSQSLSSIAAVATLIAVLSATLDIALDAFRRELLDDQELGLGNAIHVNAYKVAGLIPGSLSLWLADRLPWFEVFAVTGLFMLPGLLMTLRVSEPGRAPAPRTLAAAVTEPFREFLHRSGVKSALLVLGFIFLYKLGDSLCTALATPFYLEMGYTKTEIGLVAKNAGLWPSVIGGLLGGLWMVRLGINRSLWLFGAVQMLAILGFAWLAGAGSAPATPERLLALALVIGIEAFGVGLGTAAFVAFIARTTHPAYTATQFALFTSLAAVPRTVVNASAGWLVEQLGWVHFFGLCFLLAIPGMLLLFKIAPWNSTTPQNA
ncbi:AmpG family muropeptide MFS transporter [Propionivibrio dicarboxylicus]|uniref:MFS transporter, PAT family, beta-lactamase induction signal transducer AmpG n=1 Tax=Propionivibrio dicarboxylicus TaxID=83767 RepID=A0A1G7VZG1_9RHOO|nr:AmpG family muropeptide MFS transporter [Propionivibrio dicarboxylicus]SDG64270.1 MFS transporter, PAT family, beta-lactamase induction signal transducer AmpG [Propionivibrio dicarboxylicus]